MNNVGSLLPRIHVLVVGRATSAVQGLCRRLDEAGFVIDTCVPEAAVLPYLRERHDDIVIVDLQDAELLDDDLSALAGAVPEDAGCIVYAPAARCEQARLTKAGERCLFVNCAGSEASTEMEIHRAIGVLLRQRVARLERALAARTESDSAQGDSSERRQLYREASVHCNRAALFEWHPEGDHLVTTPAWAEQIGYGRDELGNSLAATMARLHSEDREVVENALCQVTQGNVLKISHQFRLRHRDGSYRWFRLRGNAICDKSGRVGRLIGCRTDVTEEVQSLAKIQLLYRAMEATSEGISILDMLAPEQPVVYVNRGFERMTGYGAAEVVGHELQFLRGPKTSADDIQTLALAIRERRECSVELLNYRKDGTPFWNHIVLAPIEDEHAKVTHAVAIHTDVTRLRRTQEELRRRESQLERVSHVAGMGGIIAAIAHEIRQPLHAISNFADGAQIRLRNGTIEDKDLIEVLKLIHDASHHASETIGRLRGMVDDYSPDFESVQLNDVIRESMAMLAPEAGQEGITFRTCLAEELPAVVGDSVQIEQVLLNLLRNAMDAVAGNPGNRRIVTMRSKSPDATSIEVSIEDTGPGLGAASPESLFVPMYTTKRNGLGMGLSICRFLIAGHQGQIYAEPLDAGGTAVRFTLPTVQA